MCTYRMSAHARERWAERTDEPVPSDEEASRLIQESIEVQRHLEVYTPRGRRMTVPAMYWHPIRGLILVAHGPHKVIMTIITQDMPTGPRQRGVPSRTEEDGHETRGQGVLREAACERGMPVRQDQKASSGVLRLVLPGPACGTEDGPVSKAGSRIRGGVRGGCAVAANLPLVIVTAGRCLSYQPWGSAGDRMIDCPHYGECLRFAMDAGWGAWNCEACDLYSPEEPLMSACGTIQPKNKSQAVAPAAPSVPKFKQCIRCERVLEVNSENFRPNRTARDGYYNTCRVCHENQYVKSATSRPGGGLRTRVVLKLASKPDLLQRLADDARACNDTIERHAIWIIETYFRALDGEAVTPRGGR